jgi:hypothetical protein
MSLARSFLVSKSWKLDRILFLAMLAVASGNRDAWVPGASCRGNGRFPWRAGRISDLHAYLDGRCAPTA